MEERLVVVVGYDDAELLDIACITSALSLTSEIPVRPRYTVLVASPGGAPIECVSGLTLQTQEALERMTGPIDTLIISGGRGPEAVADDKALIATIRRLAHSSRRVASVCTGATILAATGLLDGRRATTHWGYARRLAVRHPAVVVDADPIFIRDGNVFTSAGITSALDLTLALIEDDHGSEVARTVARILVTYLQRPGNQAQMSMFVTPPPVGHDVVRRVVDHINAHLTADLSASALASTVGISERHLARLFADEIGQTPGRFVRSARTEAAALLLSTTPLPVAQIAVRCGFTSTETLRQAFTGRYGVAPSRFRLTQGQRAEPPRARSG